MASSFASPLGCVPPASRHRVAAPIADTYRRPGGSRGDRDAGGTQPQGEAKLEASGRRWGDSPTRGTAGRRADLEGREGGRAGGRPARRGRSIRKDVPVEREFARAGWPRGHGCAPFRVPQWENLLLFVPLPHGVFLSRRVEAGTTVIAFSRSPSRPRPSYVLNDLWDLENDRPPAQAAAPLRERPNSDRAGIGRLRRGAVVALALASRSPRASC